MFDALLNQLRSLRESNHLAEFACGRQTLQEQIKRPFLIRKPAHLPKAGEKLEANSAASNKQPIRRQVAPIEVVPLLMHLDPVLGTTVFGKSSKD